MAIKVQPGLAYLVFCPLDGGNIHVVGGGAHIFILFVGEDVDTNHVNLQRKCIHVSPTCFVVLLGPSSRCFQLHYHQTISNVNNQNE